MLDNAGKEMTIFNVERAMLFAAVCLACTFAGCRSKAAGGGKQLPPNVQQAEVVRSLWTSPKDLKGPLSELYSPPAASDEVLLVESGYAARAFGAGDGKPLWRASASHCVMPDSRAVLLNDVALSCVDAETRSQRWTKELEADWDLSDVDLAASRQAVVLATPTRTAAYDLATGRELWQYQQSSDAYPSESVVMLAMGPATTVVVHGRARQEDHRDDKIGPVVAIKTENGKELWRYEPPSPVFAEPCLVDDVLLLRTDRQIIAVSAKTGQELWSSDAPLPAKGGVAVAGINRIVYSVSGQTMIGYELVSGRERERCDLPDPIPAFISLGSSVLAPVDGLLAIACLRLDEHLHKGVFYLYSPRERRIVYSSDLFNEAIYSQVIAHQKRIFFMTAKRIAAMELVVPDRTRDKGKSAE